jgi:glycosyltransferase involved in cell wall biosynthesis
MPDYAEARKNLAHLEANPSTALGRVLQRAGVRGPLLRAALEMRAYFLRTLDAHVNYVDYGRELFASYGVPDERIFVTRNSPDTDAMSRIEAELLASEELPQRGPYRLLHVGRLVASKRVDLLLQAMPRVCARIPDAELVIVGDGPEREAFEREAARLGISRAVRFMGAVYDPLELGRHFLSASLFVLPGLGGLSINEAMFYGLAIICASGDGTEKFLVREGYNGSFFRADDRTSLGDTIVRLLSDQQELKKMGARSREIIDREVNIGTVIREYRRAFFSARA